MIEELTVKATTLGECEELMDDKLRMKLNIIDGAIELSERKVTGNFISGFEMTQYFREV